MGKEMEDFAYEIKKSYGMVIVIGNDRFTGSLWGEQ